MEQTILFKKNLISFTFVIFSVSVLAACGGESETFSISPVDENNNEPTINNSIFDAALLLPAEGGEGSLFNDGASWESFNRGAGLRWDNTGGDYFDANGVNQGDVPWATQTIVDTNTIKEVSWNVTDLVQAWTDSTYVNSGFHIRYLSGGTGPIDYASKEGDNSAHHPKLVVSVQNGNGFTFAPIGDTDLSSQSQTVTRGQNTQMRIKNLTYVSLLWFDLSSLQGEVITSAELKLTSVKQFSSSDVIQGVFAVRTKKWDQSAPLMGIAKDFANDIGLSNHPDVYLSYSFNSDEVSDGQDFLDGSINTARSENFWPCKTDAPTGKERDGSVSTAQPGIPGYVAFQDTGDAICLRLKHEVGAPNTQGLGNYGVGIKKSVDSFSAHSQVEELFVRHYLFLADSWGESINNEGGKRPGGITGRQVGTTYAAGWGGRTTDGANGWSARGGYSEIIPDGFNPLAGYTPISTYLYHADQSGAYGDRLTWRGSPNSLVKRGRWYAIEQQVKMNTRDGLNIQGSSGTKDGIIRGWIDGRLVFERTNIRFTDMNYINIDVADFGLYYGGAGNTPHDQHMAIDNVVISKSYIGPMKTE